MCSRVVLLFALSATVLLAQAPPAFEVSTVRPSAGPIPGVPPIFGQQRTTADTLNARHTVLIEIIRRAFGVVEQELAGGPDWIREKRFDLVRKSSAPGNVADAWRLERP